MKLFDRFDENIRFPCSAVVGRPAAALGVSGSSPDEIPKAVGKKKKSKHFFF